MKTETLELIIEELASALNTERWYTKSLREENDRLKAELDELKDEIADLKGLLDSKYDGCAGRATMTEDEDG